MEKTIACVVTSVTFVEPTGMLKKRAGIVITTINSIIMEIDPTLLDGLLAIVNVGGATAGC